MRFPLLQIHNGPPHESNFGYAYAKRMIDVHNRYVMSSLSSMTHFYIVYRNVLSLCSPSSQLPPWQAGLEQF